MVIVVPFLDLTMQSYKEKTNKQNNSAKTYTNMKKQMLAMLLLLLPFGMTAQDWDLLKRD
jgi:hypothetical protein